LTFLFHIHGHYSVEARRACPKACGNCACLVDGNAGDGTEQGSCPTGYLCEADGNCQPGLHYQLTGSGETCPDIGLNKIVDEGKCKKAVEDLGRTYRGNETARAFPSGCYAYGDNSGYFNYHESGTRSDNAKSICKPGDYSRVSSENCVSLGMNYVTSKEECEIAATKLGLSDTSAYSTTAYSTSGRPYGCIYGSDNWLVWNEKRNDVPVPCGTKHDSSEYDCLCKTSDRTR
jgi:hypothetical protein